MCTKQTIMTDFVKSEIASNDVVVFSKSYCPFCDQTKSLFKSMSITPKVHELDTMDTGSEIQDALIKLSGQRTVPNVYVKGYHIGGNSDTQQALRSGKLKGLLGMKNKER